MTIITEGLVYIIVAVNWTSPRSTGQATARKDRLEPSAQTEAAAHSGVSTSSGKPQLCT